MGTKKRGGASIVGQASGERTLWSAWARVASGSRMAGVDGVTVDRFARSLGTELSRLSELLRTAGYRAQPLLQIELRRGAKPRSLGVPTVRDRVAQRAFLDVLERRLDGHATDASFAYRRGRSWLDALRRAEQCRDAGLRWVCRADIEEFFDRIDHGRIAEQLALVCREPAAERIVMAWVTAALVTPNGMRQRRRGLPQGAPISPALANHFLADFDRAVDGAHGRLIRYADDIAVFCADEEAAHRARHDVDCALAALGLQANGTKTYVSSFDRGFAFLGWVFFRDDGYEEDPNGEWTHPMTVGRRRRRR